MKSDQSESVGDLNIVRSVSALRLRVAAWQRAGETVALVPTMGALHAGHLALVARGQEIADHVVTSIFVNPTQFGPHEDFNAYLRDEAGDATKLAMQRCDLLYAPAVDEIYPSGFSTSITVGPIAERLCGLFRPGHFSGVATVVCKLLLQSQAEIACFGEKDYQQLQVIRRVVRDLDIPVHIVGVPTVREPDGLALSSRNAYLSATERLVAPTLHRVLLETAATIQRREKITDALATAVAGLQGAGFTKIDYLEACDTETLEPLKHPDGHGRVFGAAWLGKTRLIDNVPMRSLETDRPIGSLGQEPRRDTRLGSWRQRSVGVPTRQTARIRLSE